MIYDCVRILESLGGSSVGGLIKSRTNRARGKSNFVRLVGKSGFGFIVGRKLHMPIKVCVNFTGFINEGRDWNISLHSPAAVVKPVLPPPLSHTLSMIELWFIIGNCSE